MTMDKTLCPICAEGHLQAQTRLVDVEYKGATGRIDDHFVVCDVCEIEQAGEAELRDNKRAMLAFRKQAGGLLAGEQVRELRDRWQLTQAQAAQIFGGGPVAFSKYESNDVAQSESMDLLLRVAEAVPEAFQWLFNNAGLEVETVSDYTREVVAACLPTRLRLPSHAPSASVIWEKKQSLTLEQATGLVTNDMPSNEWQVAVA